MAQGKLNTKQMVKAESYRDNSGPENPQISHSIELKVVLPLNGIFKKGFRT